MNPNQFMHQNQILDSLGSFAMYGLVRPPETIQNLILMHKLIRIPGVSGSTKIKRKKVKKTTDGKERRQN